MSEDSEYMSKIIDEHLTGGRIVGAFVGTGDEGYFGFDVARAGKILHVWVNQDPEGNGPGFLSIEQETTK